MNLQHHFGSSLDSYLQTLHEQYTGFIDGKVADYIPELSHADPNWFGIAIVTVDGRVFQVGDSHEDFTIQSISKAITYGLALTDHGVEYVTTKVGVEPSGDAFNSISLDPVTGQPCNPMINAGAIATTAMIHDKDGVSPIDRILKAMAKYVGHELEININVYESESETGHRNRAISHLLRNFDIVSDDHLDSLETYFQQCSINVNCRDLAVMAACLANNGVNPITGEIALEHRFVDKVLSVMGSCGMYDYSGNWLYRVGMPAKSGVGGGIMAVLPGQFGLAVFSPLLDDLGNSVRGIKVCEDISRDFGLHLFHTARATSASVLRVKFNAIKVHSRKSRFENERQYLIENGQRIRGYELQGELMFGSTVSVISELMEETGHCEYFIIDMHRVVAVDDAAARLWLECIVTLHEMGKHNFLTGVEEHYKFVRFLAKQLPKHIYESLFQFSDRDHALEWCEDNLLAKVQTKTVPSLELDLANQQLCKGLTQAQLLRLNEIVKEIRFAKGDVIFHRGSEAHSMFFIKSGLAEVYLKIDNQREKRLTTLSSGMTFGEIAMLNQNIRTATVRAIEDTICYELAFKDIDDTIRTVFFANLAIQLASRVESETQEIEAMY